LLIFKFQELSSLRNDQYSLDICFYVIFGVDSVGSTVSPLFKYSIHSS